MRRPRESASEPAKNERKDKPAAEARPLPREVSSRNPTEGTSSRSPPEPHPRAGPPPQDTSSSTRAEERSKNPPPGQTGSASTVELNSRSKTTSKETRSRIHAGASSSRSASELVPGFKSASGSSVPLHKTDSQSIGRASRTRVVAKEPELEDLEAGLIQKIMLLALEPNLGKAARTSLTLSRALSDERLYKPFILLAFFENGRKFPVDNSHFKPATYQFLTLNQRIRLQKEIFDCPWFTFNRVKDCVDTLVYLAIVQEWRSRQKQAQLAGTSIDRPSPPSANDVEGRKAFLYLTAYNDLQPDIPCTLILQEKFEGCDQTLVKEAMVFHYIPSQALNPKTWNDGAIDYLFFVQQRISPKPNFKVMALFQGMETAILEHSCKALWLLTTIYHAATVMHERSAEITKTQLTLPPRLFDLVRQQGDYRVCMLEMLTKGKNIPSTEDGHASLLTLARGTESYNWSLTMEQKRVMMPEFTPQTSGSDRDSHLPAQSHRSFGYRWLYHVMYSPMRYSPVGEVNPVYCIP